MCTCKCENLSQFKIIIICAFNIFQINWTFENRSTGSKDMTLLVPVCIWQFYPFSIFGRTFSKACPPPQRSNFPFPLTVCLKHHLHCTSPCAPKTSLFVKQRKNVYIENKLLCLAQGLVRSLVQISVATKLSNFYAPFFTCILNTILKANSVLVKLNTAGFWNVC